MIKRQIVLSTLMIMLIFAFTACASMAVPSPAPPSEIVTTSPVTPEKEVWEKTWETWYREAKKQGKIVVVGSGEPWPRRALADAFTEKYGITVEDMTIRTALIAAKILTEYRAGLYLVDLIISGTTRSLDVGAAGLFESIKDVPILPEVVDSKVW